MTALLLSFADVLAPGEVLQMTRAALATGRPKALHGQDFPQLLWVQNGKVRHILPEARRDLAEGDLVFVRAGDRHALQGLGDDALVVSVLLHPALVAAIGARHPELAGQLFWSTAAEPVIRHRDSRQLAALNQAALRLERGRRDALAAEGFLLPLCAELVAEVTPLPPGAPDWLANACAAARDPAVFRDGAAGFARAAGRAHPHVSRSMRRFLNQSPSDYVNAQRMAYAARRLTGSPDPLAEIAAECGIPNLSHFHKLFRSHHGVTPQRYRKTHQRDLLQPS
jgi:AraC family cel operon transcriptional repressor